MSGDIQDNRNFPLLKETQLSIWKYLQIYPTAVLVSVYTPAVVKLMIEKMKRKIQGRRGSQVDMKPNFLSGNERSPKNTLSTYIFSTFFLVDMKYAVFIFSQLQQSMSRLKKYDCNWVIMREKLD